MGWHFGLIAYIFLIAVLEKRYGLSRKKWDWEYILYWIPLTAWAGLRAATVGNGTRNYFNFFMKTLSGEHAVLDYEGRLEPGYFLLNKLLTLVVDHPQYLFLLAAGFTVGVYLRWIKRYSPSVWLSVFVLVASLEYYGTVTIMRQCLAIAILLLAYDFLAENKKVPYLLTCGAAISFHLSSVAFLPSILLRKLNLTRRRVILIVAAAVSIFIFYDLFARILYEIPWRFSKHVFKAKFLDIEIGSIVKLAISVVVLTFGVHYKMYTSERGRLLTNLYFTGTLIMLLAIRLSILARVARYFTIFQIIYIPLFLNNITGQKERKLMTAAVIAGFILYGVATFLFRPGFGEIFPYSFFWVTPAY